MYQLISRFAHPTYLRRAPSTGMHYRFVPISTAQSVGPREFTAIAATSAMQDDGAALQMPGADLSRFKQGRGPLLDDHTPSAILGVVESAWTTPTQLLVRARFSGLGVSALADQRCAELKDGVINSLSVGFVIDKFEAIEARNPSKGIRVTAWRLLEVSLVSVPMDSGAVVTERSRRTGVVQMKQGAIRACERALEEHGRLARPHQDGADALERLDEHRAKRGTALRGLRSALAQGDDDEAAECLEKFKRHSSGYSRELRKLADAGGDMQEADAAVRSAVEGVGDHMVQTSGGVENVSDGDRSFSRRQRELAAFRLADPALTALAPGDDYRARQAAVARLRRTS